MSRLTIVSILVTIILIGIPSAANFYPPIFEGLAEQLPLNLILTWMGRVGILALGVSVGWSVRGGLQEENEPESGLNGDEEVETSDSDETTVTEIEGCIEVEGSCWRGKAELSDNRVTETEVEYRAICPHCQTVMYDGEDNSGVSVAVAGGGPDYWECPSCSHRTIDQYSKYEDAKNLFGTHVRRIAESENENYSLDNLIEKIEAEVTPQRIWEQYVEVMDNSEVSVSCFH